MRYGFFSDVHSNLEAFEQAIKFYRKERIDKYIFLGDIIGYGANPKEVIALLKSLEPCCIAGNHDWAIIDKLSAEHFNEYAQESILWTKRILDRKEDKYISSFPLFYEDNNFLCVHGSLNEPEKFNYILGTNDARVNFDLLNKQILFVGHSHKAQIYCANLNGISFCPDLEVEIKPGERYIINVGSIGQPRDRDSRLSLCVYDSEEKIIKISRLNYDITLVANKILEAGLPSMLSARLFVGM